MPAMIIQRISSGAPMARAQLEQMRQGALPPGMPAPGGAGGPGHSTGQYL